MIKFVAKTDMTLDLLFPFYPQVVTKPPEFERFSEFGESSLVESDSDYTEPLMYSNNERKDIFVIEVGFQSRIFAASFDFICFRTWRAAS